VTAAQEIGQFIEKALRRQSVEIVSENFATVRAMAALVTRQQQASQSSS
jgi:hypothetical protein